MNGRPLTPLVVVEDSDEDFEALARVLRETTGMDGVLRHRTGQAALDGVDARTPPALILLDLNLPDLRGLELLARWKSDPALGVVPVVVLSGSARDEDIKAAYTAGANAYLTKPLDLAELRRTITALQKFWQIAALPHGRP